MSKAWQGRWQAIEVTIYQEAADPEEKFRQLPERALPQAPCP